MKQNDGRADLTCITSNGVALWIAESSTPCRTSGSSPGYDTSTDADGSVDRGNTAPSVEVGEVQVVSGATPQANDGSVLVLSGSMGGGDEGEESWPDMASSNG
jgi:hypothetical protein